MHFRSPSAGTKRGSALWLWLLVPAVALAPQRVQGQPPASKPAVPQGVVQIRSDFPGGNVRVLAQKPGEVKIAPDLRGGRPWFYWCLEAKAVEPGRVTFVLPERVAGFKHGGVGFQGPAVRADPTEPWKWMGPANVKDGAFSYTFAKAGQRVRLAVTIPYLQTDLEAFLKRNAASPHLTQGVLTRSTRGRSVELLRIGTPRLGVQPMLITARHHAAETMASFVFEGFLQAALSDSPAGRAFRSKYVLYAVPFVDKDGVEEGDQGKNRRPHDHNRDYGPDSRYPEIRAIKKLDQQHNFRFALDFHCPTLVMRDHQVMYFVGAREHPRYNFENVSELAKWIRRGLPKNAPHGPLVWLRKAKKQVPMNSHYFGFKENAVLAATLEFPFAPPGKATDLASCRRYGHAILAAWANAHFRSKPDKDE